MNTPQDAAWAGAAVVLCDGRRLGWKIIHGSTPDGVMLADRYFGGHGRGVCSVKTARFEDPGAFDRAAAWCRGFERHPDAAGMEP